MSYATASNRKANSEINKLYPEDRTIHEWYRFVLSFPPHLVRDYLKQFQLNSHHRVLDPFCGTGTVLVESKKLGIASIGIEANPLAHFASQTKVDWNIDPQLLLEHASSIAGEAVKKLQAEGIEDEPFFQIIEQMPYPLRTLPDERMKLLLTNSISPLPLHKTLMLLDCMEEFRDERYYRHEQLALAKALVCSISNLQFGPEVGVGPAKTDTAVVSAWLNGIRVIASDLRKVRTDKHTPSKVYLADARLISDVLEPCSIDAVITSPPYPNEKDYTRTTRLESVLLGFLHNKLNYKHSNVTCFALILGMSTKAIMTTNG